MWGGCEGAGNLNNVRGAMGKITKCTKKVNRSKTEELKKIK